MHNMLKMTIGLGLLLLSVACGGGSDADSLMDQGKSAMAELTTILESIQDEESAKAAAPKLEALGARMKELKEQTDALPEEERKSLQDMEEDEDAKALASKMMKEMMRVQLDDKLAPHVEDAFASFQ